MARRPWIYRTVCGLLSAVGIAVVVFLLTNEYTTCYDSWGDPAASYCASERPLAVTVATAAVALVTLVGIWFAIRGPRSSRAGAQARDQRSPAAAEADHAAIDAIFGTGDVEVAEHSPDSRAAHLRAMWAREE